MTALQRLDGNPAELEFSSQRCPEVQPGGATLAGGQAMGASLLINGLGKLGPSPDRSCTGSPTDT